MFVIKLNYIKAAEGILKRDEPAALKIFIDFDYNDFYIRGGKFTEK